MAFSKPVIGEVQRQAQASVPRMCSLRNFFCQLIYTIDTVCSLDDVKKAYKDRLVMEEETPTRDFLGTNQF